MHIKEGDNVKVITGKDKGKEDKVVTTEPRKDRAVMKGVNVIEKHQKSTQLDLENGILETEAAIHVSSIRLLDPKTNEPTHIGCRTADDRKVRIAKRSGEEIKANS